MDKKPRILVVEDEEAIRNGLVDVFVFHGFEVEAAEEGREGLRLAQSGRFDLILLDVMLPHMDGFEICRRIRELDKEQAVIMLTAKSTDEEIIHGLSLGADDYVAKPFSVTQLVLRVQAVLRRSRVFEQQSAELNLGDGLTVDTLNLHGDWDGRELVFTRREVEVLQYLHVNRHRPVARDELLHKIWGYHKDMDIETRTVDIHIAKLRRKIESNPKDPQRLLTLRGAGYRLVTSDQ